MAYEDRAGRGSLSRPSPTRKIHGAPLSRKKMQSQSGPVRSGFTAAQKARILREKEKERRKRLRAKATQQAGRHGMVHRGTADMDKVQRRLDRDARTRIGGSPGSASVRGLFGTRLR